MRISVNFTFAFSRHAFGPNKCKQISMTSSQGSHAFTSSKLLPSLTTSFRRWCLCIFGDAISGSPCNEISTLLANYVRIISVHNMYVTNEIKKS